MLVGADDVRARDAGHALARRIPVRDAVVAVDHELGDGRTVDDLAQHVAERHHAALHMQDVGLVDAGHRHRGSGAEGEGPQVKFDGAFAAVGRAQADGERRWGAAFEKAFAAGALDQGPVVLGQQVEIRLALQVFQGLSGEPAHGVVRGDHRVPAVQCGRHGHRRQQLLDPKHVRRRLRDVGHRDASWPGAGGFESRRTYSSSLAPSR
jgi:hypothetical protein